MNHWIRDTETLFNLTVGVYFHYRDESKVKVFVVHELRNDLTEWLDFMENVAENKEYLIGFNSIDFDSQIETAMMRNREALLELSPTQVARKIYQKAQSVIQQQEFGERVSGIPEWQLPINQIDVFKLNHWDNPQRRASLKWLQFTCNWHTVQEMPIHHSTKITTMEQINTVVDYCINDVRFTKYIYEQSKPMLKIRQDVQRKYKINCLSYSNTKMGSELLLKLYCKKTKKKKWEIKALQTTRHHIKIADILLPGIEFESYEFRELLRLYQDTTLTTIKGELKLSVGFNGYKFDYGAGGMHQCIDSGIYKSDDEYIIRDLDVTGLYPRMAVVNGWYPAHLGPEFYEVYKNDIVDVRSREKAKGKEGDKAIVDGFKEAANATFGNSNQKHSWLNDPQYLVQTTVNGQLLITMLVEALGLNLTKAQILQTNTDGCTIRFLRSELDKYNEICKKWEEKTQLQLEFADISQMFIWDVNSYFVTYVDPSKPPKHKGRFVYDFEWREAHKNKSYLVVPKAIYQFFINGIFPEEYLKSNRNILDYCGGVRATGEWEFYGTCMSNGVLEETPLEKIVRYYVSNKGCKIVKVNKTDGRRIQAVSGSWTLTEYNSHKELPWEQYDVDEKFYLEQIRKEINALQAIKTNQLSLF